MYTAFARVYDALMESVPYAAWAQHYGQLMEQAGVPRQGRVVECACGTGSLTVPLQKMGYQMTGVDLSADMLEEAMKKARAAGVSIPFVRLDMRKLTVPRRVHCVLATCDGVNYLTDGEQAKEFFRAAYDSLRPGGALIFDVSTPDKLRNALGDRTLFSDDEGISYIWRNRFSPKDSRVEMDLSIFVRRDDGAYDRLEERQCQRAHTRRELRKWLEETGFTDIAFFGRLRMTPPRSGDDRWHVAAVKKEI